MAVVLVGANCSATKYKHAIDFYCAFKLKKLNILVEKIVTYNLKM